jgi:two-component system response regulator MprA
VTGVPGERVLILVVERDPHVRELEAHFLEEAGYAVQFAADGTSALEEARSGSPAVIITEILVPKLDGLALCRALKGDSTTQHIPIVVFSILAAKERAAEAGADAFLMKPLADGMLTKAVKGLIERRESSGRQA